MHTTRGCAPNHPEYDVRTYDWLRAAVDDELQRRTERQNDAKFKKAFLGVGKGNAAPGAKGKGTWKGKKGTGKVKAKVKARVKAKAMAKERTSLE